MDSFLEYFSLWQQGTLNLRHETLAFSAYKQIKIVKWLIALIYQINSIKSFSCYSVTYAVTLRCLVSISTIILLKFNWIFNKVMFHYNQWNCKNNWLIVPFHHIDAQNKAFIFNLFAISLYFSCIFDSENWYTIPTTWWNNWLKNSEQRFTVFGVFYIPAVEISIDTEYPKHLKIDVKVIAIQLWLYIKRAFIYLLISVVAIAINAGFGWLSSISIFLILNDLLSHKPRLKKVGDWFLWFNQQINGC